MTFLVILICIALNHAWSRDLDRFDDSWFFGLRRLSARLTGRLVIAPGLQAALTQVLTYLLPMGVLAAVLWAVQGVAIGLFSLLIHVIVLLYAIDRTQPGQLASAFLQHWRAGDLEGAYLYLREQLGPDELPPVDDHRQLLQRFARLYVYRCMEKMFVMYFWYAVTGPLGVLFSYLSYQIRDNGGSANETLPSGVPVLVAVLEWLPLRLLGLTFCLAGDFERCIHRLRAVIWEATADNDAVVHDLASAAVGLPSVGVVSEAQDFETYQAAGTLEIESIQALLERSQIIWLSVLALATIFGLG